MEEPNPELIGYKGEPIVKGSETIYEMVTAEDGFGFGVALVRITDQPNEGHWHEHTRELYVVVWGELSVRSGPKGRRESITSSIREGGSRSIEPGHVHQSHALGSHAWFYVFTWPPFDPADYHPVD
ncbi:MAG: hypothetical protein Q8P13_01825 [bacterium]|nr:hypothetical protein [bacterium]